MSRENILTMLIYKDGSLPEVLPVTRVVLRLMSVSVSESEP